MDNWRSELQKGMDLLGTLMMFGAFNDMFNAFVRPDLEKKLRRKLTDWDWQAYLRETRREAEFVTEEEKRRQRLARMDDLKTIHDFVWNRHL